MNLILLRNIKNQSGIFGELLTLSGEHICFTLERAFPTWRDQPKVPEGSFECVLGEHCLKDWKYKRPMYEVIVPHHQGILFHCGNTEEDTDGCILLGMDIWHYHDKMELGHSKLAYQKLMDIQKEVAKFTLLIENKFLT